jgi:hypothetical protein
LLLLLLLLLPLLLLVVGKMYTGTATRCVLQVL